VFIIIIIVIVMFIIIISSSSNSMSSSNGSGGGSSSSTKWICIIQYNELKQLLLALTHLAISKARYNRKKTSGKQSRNPSWSQIKCNQFNYHIQQHSVTSDTKSIYMYTCVYIYILQNFIYIYIYSYYTHIYICKLFICICPVNRLTTFQQS
jgi:hypothetical protein